MKKNYLTRTLTVLFLALGCGMTQAQGLVTGTVKNETGQGIPGTNVIVKGTTTGVSTDATGSFAIQAASNDVLVFSFIGYRTQEIQVGNQTSLTVNLVQDLTTLNEVLIVGYGTQQKKDITGAISSISQKDFENQPVYRLDQALQGRVAGVQVTNNSGAPGGDVKIRIRGANSISGGNDPLYVVDGFIGADFQNVNPDDIESIQVLKDASATAIYGSRGANGVVLITTKKGTKEGVHVNFTSRYTSAQVIKRYDLLGASDYAETVNERSAALGLNPSYTAEEIQSFKSGGGTDWQDEIFRTAYGNEQLLNISGGSAKTNFYIAGNYLDQDGIIINSGFTRYGMRANISASITDKLTLRLNASGTRKETLNVAGNRGKSGPVTQGLSWAPTTPVRNATGGYTVNDPIGSIFQNPVALANEVNTDVTSTVGNLVGGFNYEIMEGLTFDIGYGLNYENYQLSDFIGPTASGNNQATAARASDERILLQNINNLTYTKTFNDQHSLTVTAVLELQSYKAKGFTTGATNLTFPALGADNLSNINEGGTITSTGTYSNSGLWSLLGRVNYAFREKYLLTASIRQDASSKFKGSNQQSVFPSVGIGWRISEEGFMKGVTAITNLKLRAGYGVTGNQGIGPYGTYSNYLSDPYSAFTSFTNSGLSTGIVLGNPGNPNLKWETTAQSNVGLDVEFKGAFTLGVDYFVKNTSDLLLYQPVPNYAGGGVIASNVGKVQNKGIEVFISATPIKRSGFQWETSFNFTSIDNKVVSLGGQPRIFTGSNVGSGLSTQSEFVLVPGEPMGSVWGVNYLGTWKPSEAAEAALFGANPGDSRYEDVDGDKQLGNGDFKIIGSGMPKVSLGFNNTFTYKRLSFNIFLQSLANYDKLNYMYGVSVSATADSRQATHSDIKGHYIPGVNETSDIPAFSSTDKVYTQSSRFLQSGDFVRIKNISLSYDLPLKAVGLKLFVSATNPYTFTDYKGFDPESSSVVSGNDVDQSIDYGSYPNSKTYIIGVTFKF
jgi:TonB-linked SusC/RagA family outer membrane protein